MFYSYNGNRHGMSTNSTDEMTIDLSQDNNWVKAKFYIVVKENEDQNWHDTFLVNYI